MAENFQRQILTQDTVVDIEEYAKEGKEPPKGGWYQIRIDKERHVVETSEVTGRRILELAKKAPVENFRVDLKLKGGATRKIELDDVVDLTEKGVERFMTLPLDQTEG